MKASSFQKAPSSHEVTFLRNSTLENHKSFDTTWQDVQKATDAALNNAGFWYILPKYKERCFEINKTVL